MAGIRSRAHWVDTGRWPTGSVITPLVHMTLKIGAGRSPEKSSAGG
ncbi:hypothetical protein ACP0HM_28360 [Escherichia coli]